MFSGNASPIAGTMKAFKGTDVYGVDDLPEIDYLFVSLDHYDHLDYETITKLKSKVKKSDMRSWRRGTFRTVGI